MKIVFFSKNLDIIDEWKKKYEIVDFVSCFDEDSLQNYIADNESAIVLADYDTVAPEVNKLITSNTVPERLVVLERCPAVVTGKMLIARGIKAYGNSRMSHVHFRQMLHTVLDGNIWTYPELTSALILIKKSTKLNEEALGFIHERLTPQEIEVVHYILDGLTNDAIAAALNITSRTVKAHITSIFAKLHVSDRLSLVLLLK